METLQSLMTKEYIARLETLRLHVARKLSAGFQGARKSNAKGNSLEFADFKDYVPGDDTRRIDWNSYGRFDKLFLKLYTEEKQANVNLFIDVSKSMDFGEPNKLLYAKLTAATIAYVAMKNADKVNVFGLDDKITLQKRGMATKNLFAGLVAFLDDMPPGGRTNLAAAIREAAAAPLGQGLCFIISDFFSEDIHTPDAPFFEALRLLQSKKQHLGLIHVLDRREIAPDNTGACRLLDAETNAAMDLFMTNDVLEGYAAALSAFQTRLKDFTESRGGVYRTAPTDESVLKLLYLLNA